jgi:hypothetical protein
MRPLPILAALALLAPTAPAAALMLQVPVDEAARSADAIVQARVVQRASAYDPATGLIHTDVTLEVLETWKGAPAVDGRITVRVLGGEVDGIGMRREHEPTFADGETAVVFLVATPSARWGVQHLEQGKFRLENGQIHDARGHRTPVAEFKAAVGRFLQTPKR